MVEREQLHFRQVSMRGYRRSDGLFEVEGQVVDRKPHAFVPASGGETVPANEPIHDLGVRIVFDDAMIIHEVTTFTRAAPYPVCPEGGRALADLAGLRLGAGFGGEVRKRLGGERSCAHLRELLMPLATTALQAMSAVHADRPEAVDAEGKPRKIDSCFAYAADGDLVRLRWPEHHRQNGGRR